MHERITVLRAPPGTVRRSFVERLQRSGDRVYVTEGDDRPATAIVVGAVSPLDGVITLATYDVELLLQWDDEMKDPCFAMFAFFSSAPGLDHAEFVRRYREHARVARVQHPALRRYVQDIVVSQHGEERWRCDAISELYFTSRADYEERFWRDESSREVVARDTARFSEAATSKMVLAAEVRLDRAGGPGI